MQTDTNHTLYLVANENYRMLTWYCELLEKENYWEQPQKILGYSIYEFLELYTNALLIRLADTLEKTDQEHRKFILTIMKQNLLNLSAKEEISHKTKEEAERILKAPPILLQLCGLRDFEKATGITGLFFDALLNLMLTFGNLNGEKNAGVSAFLKEFYEKIKVFLYYGSKGENLLDETYLFYKLCSGDFIKHTQGLSLAGESFDIYLEETLQFKCRKNLEPDHNTALNEQNLEEEIELEQPQQQILQEVDIQVEQIEEQILQESEVEPIEQKDVEEIIEPQQKEQIQQILQETESEQPQQILQQEILEEQNLFTEQEEFVLDSEIDSSCSMPKSWADLRTWADEKADIIEQEPVYEQEETHIVVRSPKKEEEQATLEQLLEKLNHLVGLKEVKKEIRSLVNLIQIRKLRKQYNLPEMEMSYHMVFTGNPGTGKTTVARLVAEIYKELGLLSKGTLVETDRSGLVAGYIGQTALKVKEVIESAMGGVLFIDEAYSLSSNLGVNDFGGEAIDTLVKLMEDKRDDLVVIAAGYTEEMKGFLKANTGLVSRFNKFIEFQDYTNQELIEILNAMAEEAGFHLEEETVAIIQNYLETRSLEEVVSFGNARGIRNIFEKLVVNQANRIVEYEKLTLDQLSSITAEDAASWKRESKKPRKKTSTKPKVERSRTSTKEKVVEKPNKCLKKRAEIHKLQDA